jgi:hypothetical protein
LHGRSCSSRNHPSKSHLASSPLLIRTRKRSQLRTPHPAQPSSPGQAQSPAQGQAQAAQTFTGTVSKEADSFVLKVSDTASYKLDNQEQVQEYQGQRVRVTGTLDPSINLIHVDRIEPLS